MGTDGQEEERKSDRRFTDREEIELRLEQMDVDFRTLCDGITVGMDKSYIEWRDRLLVGMGEAYRQWRRVMRDNLLALAGMKHDDDSVSVADEDAVQPE